MLGPLCMEITPLIIPNPALFGPLGAGRVVINLPRTGHRGHLPPVSCGSPLRSLAQTPWLSPTRLHPPELNEEEGGQRSWFRKGGH